MEQLGLTEASDELAAQHKNLLVEHWDNYKVVLAVSQSSAAAVLPAVGVEHLLVVSDQDREYGVDIDYQPGWREEGMDSGNAEVESSKLLAWYSLGDSFQYHKILIVKVSPDVAAM